MFDSFVTAHWFDPEAKAIWRDTATLQAWLDVESALAAAQAELGIVPADAAERIHGAAHIGRFDLERLAREIAYTQHPLVPVLAQFEALCGEPAAGYLHWGATTQNIFDTAASLQMKATHRLLVQRLDRAIASLATHASAHRATAMAGRTHGQHALPTTMGCKLATWIDELDRDRERLVQRVANSFVASMGGAIGTYAAAGPQGREVEVRLAARLGLRPSGLSSRASYDRVCDYVSALGLLCGTAQKIAQDIVFLQRTEIDEVSEAFYVGKVGSSTMAQKRNPSGALMLVSLCRMLRARVGSAEEAMVRADEGDSSSTNVTDVLLPEIAVLGVSIADALARLAEGLVIHPEAMRRNLASTHGLIAAESVMMRLTRYMGRHEAHRLVYDAAQEARSSGRPFPECVAAHALIAEHGVPRDIASALDPAGYVGEAVALTDETVARVQAR